MKATVLVRRDPELNRPNLEIDQFMLPVPAKN